MIWSSPSTSRSRTVVGTFLAAMICHLFVISACRSDSEAEQEIYNSSISYPFGYGTNPIGKDKPLDDQRVIIRSTSGNREYVVEIPDGAKDYDLEIPLAPELGDGTNSATRSSSNPQVTDSEMVSDMPQSPAFSNKDSAIINRSLGLGPEHGPQQGPSYTLGIAKVNQLYLDQQFEMALIEVNNLIAYYPNSAKLHKMKGTLYHKMQNYRLAKKSWQTALTLEPGDEKLRQAIEHLSEQQMLAH